MEINVFCFNYFICIMKMEKSSGIQLIIYLYKYYFELVSAFRIIIIIDITYENPFMLCFIC